MPELNASLTPLFYVFLILVLIATIPMIKSSSKEYPRNISILGILAVVLMIFIGRFIDTSYDEMSPVHKKVEVIRIDNESKVLFQQKDTRFPVYFIDINHPDELNNGDLVELTIPRAKMNGKEYWNSNKKITWKLIE